MFGSHKFVPGISLPRPTLNKCHASLRWRSKSAESAGLIGCETIILCVPEGMSVKSSANRVDMHCVSVAIVQPCLRRGSSYRSGSHEAQPANSFLPELVRPLRGIEQSVSELCGACSCEPPDLLVKLDLQPQAGIPWIRGQTQLATLRTLILLINILQTCFCDSLQVSMQCASDCMLPGYIHWPWRTCHDNRMI